MGIDYSKDSVMYQIGINGNGNSAFIVNGITFNISTLLETTAMLTAKYYHSQLIAIHFTSIFLIFLFTVIHIQCRKLHRRNEKGRTYNKKS